MGRMMFPFPAKGGAEIYEYYTLPPNKAQGQNSPEKR
jgi:hypothetical protein